jgi:hypothetical protein
VIHDFGSIQVTLHKKAIPLWFCKWNSQISISKFSYNVELSYVDGAIVKFPYLDSRFPAYLDIALWHFKASTIFFDKISRHYYTICWLMFWIRYNNLPLAFLVSSVHGSSCCPQEWIVPKPMLPKLILVQPYLSWNCTQFSIFISKGKVGKLIISLNVSYNFLNNNLSFTSWPLRLKC